MTAECRSIRASATVLRRFAHALFPVRLERLERSLQVCFQHRLQLRPLAIRLHQRQQVVFLERKPAAFARVSNDALSAAGNEMVTCFI